MEFIYGLFIFAIALFVLGLILQVFAKRQMDFHLVGASVQEARDVLVGSGVLRGGWTQADGRGYINIRPTFLLGGRKGRPIMSIDLEPDREGTHVQIWLSAWISNFGVMEPMHSLLVILRRNKIIKTLNSVSDPITP